MRKFHTETMQRSILLSFLFSLFFSPFFSPSQHQQHTSWGTFAESDTRSFCRWSDCCSTTIASCLLSLLWQHWSWTTLSEYSSGTYLFTPSQVDIPDRNMQTDVTALQSRCVFPNKQFNFLAMTNAIKQEAALKYNRASRVNVVLITRLDSDGLILKLHKNSSHKIKSNWCLWNICIHTGRLTLYSVATRWQRAASMT